MLVNLWSKSTALLNKNRRDYTSSMWQLVATVLSTDIISDYKNPLHLHVVDRDLRRFGIKRFQARLRRVRNRFTPRSLVSLSRSPTKSVFLPKTRRYQRVAACHTLLIQIRKWCVVARVLIASGYGFLWCKSMYTVPQDPSPINI